MNYIYKAYHLWEQLELNELHQIQNGMFDVITFDFRKVFCVRKFTIVIYTPRGWVFLNNQATVPLVLLDESIHIHISSHSHYKLYGEQLFIYIQLLEIS